MTFLASSFCSWSLRIREKDVSFFAASLSFSCSAWNSVRATFLASGANCLAAAIFCATFPRAVLSASAALATAASVSLITARAASFICSANSVDSGFAAVSTVSSASSATATASMASGRASSRSLASLCSFFISSSSAFARCFSSSPSWRFFAKSCLACLVSCQRFDCTARMRDISALSAAAVLGADRLASMTSTASFFWASSIEVCWA
mmetsp:Transcript_96877/g.273992  ORF Transcript_96877/g.273992 Transcript_96877/m.273992 type:complete len:209 (-) Transcript_96877:153-779(-)